MLASEQGSMDGEVSPTPLGGEDAVGLLYHHWEKAGEKGETGGKALA